MYRASLVGEFGFEKPLVIKTILPEFANQPRFIELFATEAKTAVALSHGNIVPIYELGRADDTFYIVMGFVDGPSVAQLLARHRQRGDVPPLAVTMAVVRGVLTGLAYAHTAQPERPAVVHRDITPRNIMLERSGQVRIVDFGIAQPADHHTQMRAGSTGYIAPEQARAEPVDPRADVFSVGCLLFELLAVERAFPREGVWTTPDLRRVPEVFREPLASALALDPADRPTDARALLARLQPALTKHGATFGEADLAAHLRAVFPDGTWSNDAASPDKVTPATGVTRNPVTFATRLTPISEIDDARRSVSAQPSASPPESKLVPPAPEPAAPNPTTAAAAQLTRPAEPQASRRPVLLLGLLAATIVIGVLAWPRAPSPGASAAAPEPAPARVVAAAPTLPVDSAAAQSAETTPSPPPIVPIILTTVPATASVYLDGKPSAGLSPHSIPAPREGTLHVLVEAPDHEPTTIEIHPGDTEPRSVTLSERVTGKGHVQVLAPSVSWAQVTIDGRSRGVTPTRKLELPAGPHKVIVRCVPDVCPEPKVLLRRSVVVTAGETTRITVP